MGENRCHFVAILLEEKDLCCISAATEKSTNMEADFSEQECAPCITFDG